MSSYITVTELQNQIGVGTLKQLSNDNDPTTLNTTLIETLITYASGTIDDYLRQGYGDEIPFTSPSNTIKRICGTIVIYDLYNRRSTVPDGIQRAYDDAIFLLEKIGKDRYVELTEGLQDGGESFTSYTDETDTEWAESETLTVDRILGENPSW
jgi:phage gp36-like protein